MSETGEVIELHRFDKNKSHKVAVIRKEEFPETSEHTARLNVDFIYGAKKGKLNL